MEKMEKTKELKINTDTLFYLDLIDKSKQINVNSVPTSKGYYNLIVSIRDLSLYSKGIKPHRYWKISDVKTYFGIKGTATQMHLQLCEIRDLIKECTTEK